MTLFRSWVWLVVMALCLGYTSCAWMTPASKRLAERRSEVGEEFREEIQNQLNPSTRGILEISWQDAVEKMYLQNPELIQADHRIVDARERQHQIWKNMIPGLTAGVNDSFTLRNIDEAFGDPRYRLTSFLSLGNLVDLPERVYAARLFYMGAELQAENTMRQQVIALYRLFREQELLELEKKSIDLEGALLKGMSGLSDAEVLEMRVDYLEALETWHDHHEAWKTKVGDFFMAGYDEVNLKSASLPNITYRPTDIDFSDTERWGFLQLNLLALESIAEDGRLLDAYLRYLPRANLSVSAPSLYSSTSSESFDWENIRLGPSLNWRLDSRGIISNQISRLKRQKPLEDWRKDKRRREEVARLLEGKQALSVVQQQLATLRKAMNGYRELVANGLVHDSEKVLAALRKLRAREARLAAKEIEICTSLWLIDEHRWENTTRRWLETRDIRTAQRKDAEKSNRKFFLPWKRRQS